VLYGSVVLARLGLGLGLEFKRLEICKIDWWNSNAWTFAKLIST